MITTKAELLKEFDRMVENYDDDILFCMREYKHIMAVDDIAMYFTRAFKNRIWAFAYDFLEEEEDE